MIRHIDWMPTTGEYGPLRGFDDFNEHTDLATLFGLAYTYSEEDRQGQPGTEDINNSQIRLSDGTRIFPRANLGALTPWQANFVSSLFTRTRFHHTRRRSRPLSHLKPE